MFSSLQEFFFAKAFVYKLNARDDARIAGSIISYITRKHIPRGNDTIATRAKRFIAISKNKSILFSMAYCIQEINGLVDVTYAELFERLFLSFSQRQQIKTYFGGELSRAYGRMRIVNLLRTWMFILLGNLSDLFQYAADTGSGVSINRKDALIAIQIVQSENIASNNFVAENVFKNTKTENSKVKELRAVAATMKNPGQFLVWAAKTELAASFWDALFIRLLTLLPQRP